MMKNLANKSATQLAEITHAIFWSLLGITLYSLGCWYVYRSHFVNGNPCLDEQHCPNFVGVVFGILFAVTIVGLCVGSWYTVYFFICQAAKRAQIASRAYAPKPNDRSYLWLIPIVAVGIVMFTLGFLQGRGW